MFRKFRGEGGDAPVSTQSLLKLSEKGRSLSSTSPRAYNFAFLGHQTELYRSEVQSVSAEINRLLLIYLGENVRFNKTTM